MRRARTTTLAAALAALPPIAVWNPAMPQRLVDAVRVEPSMDITRVAFDLHGLPQGLRAVEISGLGAELVGDPRDRCLAPNGELGPYPSPWLTHGSAAASAQVGSFLRALSATGERVDLILVDPRRTLSAESLGEPAPQVWAAIAADRRFAPWAQPLGIKSLTNMHPGTTDWIRWQYAIGGVFDAAAAAAFTAPARANLPEAKCSIAGSYSIAPERASIHWNPSPEVRTRGANLAEASPIHDGWISPAAEVWQGAGLGPAGGSAFDAFRKEVHRARSMRLSDKAPNRPWFRGDTVPADLASPFTNSPLQSELVRHLLLMGCPGACIVGDGGWREALLTAAVELNDHAALSGEWLETPAPLWTDRVVVTGARTATRQIWRIAAIDGITRVQVLINAQPRTVEIAPGQTGAWLVLGISQVLGRVESGAIQFAAFEAAPTLPRVITRANAFLSTDFAHRLHELGVSTDCLEIYPQNPPVGDDDGDPHRLAAAAPGGAGTEQSKLDFDGWNLTHFPRKAYGWGPTAVSGGDSGHLSEWVDASPVLEVIQNPSAFDGLIDVDYEGWCAEWRAADPRGMTPGDRHLMQSFAPALSSLRNHYPQARVAFYGLPEGWWSPNPAGPGIMAALSDSPVLLGDSAVPLPRGGGGADAFRMTRRQMDAALARVDDPEFVAFVAEHIDVLTPSAYMRSQDDGRPGWPGTELVGASTEAERAAAAQIGARTAPPGKDLEAWNRNVYRGVLGTLGTRSIALFTDPTAPSLGAHSSNYWRTRFEVQVCRRLQANVQKLSGRRLPIYPVVGWHNPTGLQSETTVLPPFSVAEFREGSLQAAADAGADGVYIWDWYLPLAMEWMVANRTLDSQGAINLLAQRAMVRAQLKTADLDRLPDGSPLLPATDSARSNLAWSDLKLLSEVGRRLEQARLPYYQAAVEVFPSITK